MTPPKTKTAPAALPGAIRMREGLLDPSADLGASDVIKKHAPEALKQAESSFSKATALIEKTSNERRRIESDTKRLGPLGRSESLAELATDARGQLVSIFRHGIASTATKIGEIDKVLDAPLVGPVEGFDPRDPRTARQVERATNHVLATLDIDDEQARVQRLDGLFDGSTTDPILRAAFDGLATFEVARIEESILRPRLVAETRRTFRSNINGLGAKREALADVGARILLNLTQGRTALGLGGSEHDSIQHLAAVISEKLD